MAGVVLTAPAYDLAARRRLLAQARSHLRSLTNEPSATDRLSRVVWELLTNLEHAGAAHESAVLITFDERRCVMRLPGSPFDSVARSRNPHARGLDTAQWLLDACGWRWSYQYVDGSNEVSLERELP